MDVGQGLPVILIHGLFLDHTAFESQIQAFSDRYRIIAIDIHGHGGSSELDRSMLLDEMAADYFDLVQQLGIQQAIWVGVPTIVAGGDKDTALPVSASQEIQQRISNSTLVEIDRCGHSSSIEQPERVNQLLEQLLLELNGIVA